MEPRTSVIKNRLKNVNRVIPVASGKGGVGKSLIATSTALSLSKKGFKVGLLDLDLYGPSAHIILGLQDFSFPEEDNGILSYNVHGIKFMSVVYFTENKPSAFRGHDITNIIIELLAITRWDDLDYLIIDMPPGIGDEILDVIRFLPDSEFVVVSTPSKVAMGAVEKLLKILKEIKTPVLGVIENMKMNESNFVKNDVEKMSFSYMGSINFDKNLERSIGKVDKLMNSDFMEDLEKITKKI